jgi:hypothetical protein
MLAQAKDIEQLRDDRLQKILGPTLFTKGSNRTSLFLNVTALLQQNNRGQKTSYH